MVRKIIYLCAFLVVNSFCCFGPGEEGPPDPEQLKLDSIAEAEDRFQHLTLEEILGFGSMDSIVKGMPGHVVHDTIRFAPDSFMFTTRVLRDSMCTIRIFWNGTTNGPVISHVVLSVDDSVTLDEVRRMKIISCTGVKLGMTLQEVQNINNEPFFIHGIGGDSSLQFISWADGRLWHSGLEVDYYIPGDHGNCRNHLICGDTAVVTNEPDLRAIDTCYVRKITLRKFDKNHSFTHR